MGQTVGSLVWCQSAAHRWGSWAAFKPNSVGQHTWRRPLPQPSIQVPHLPLNSLEHVVRIGALLSADAAAGLQRKQGVWLAHAGRYGRQI